MLRYLRIAVSLTSLVACMLLIALWVRSYWWGDAFHNEVDWLQSSRLEAFNGRLRYYGSEFPTTSTWETHSWSLDDPLFNHLRSTSMWSYRTDGPGPGVPPLFRELVVPYWFPVLLTGVLAAALGIRRPIRFSLRTLLIATTIIATWLGLIVSLI